MDDAAIPSVPKRYRLPHVTLEIGIAGAVFSGIMGIGSVAAALANADGSFPQPITWAIVFGIFWLCLSLLGVWVILSYRSYRLLVSPESIRVTGCFQTRELVLADVERAIWKVLPKSGRLVLHAGAVRVTIWMGNHPVADRLQLIRFFRAALRSSAQEGWDRFERECVPPSPPDYKQAQAMVRGLVRFTAIAWAVALPPMFTLVIWLKLERGFEQVVIGALLLLAIAGVMVGGVWLAGRAARSEGLEDNA